MNASRNCSDTFLRTLIYGLKKYFFLTGLLFVFCVDVSSAELVNNQSEAINITDYVKVLAGLLFVIALFLASTFLFKRFGNGPMLGRGQLRVIDGLHIGSRERLMLVECNGKQILLAITPGKINRIDTMDAVTTNEGLSDVSLDIAPSVNSVEQS